MSTIKVDGFFEKVAESKGLQAKLKALQKKLAKDTEAKSASALVKIASAAGFKFTAKDFLKARKAKAGKRPAKAMPEVAGQAYCPGGFDTGWGCYW
jgi:hypothetical protein